MLLVFSGGGVAAVVVTTAAAEFPRTGAGAWITTCPLLSWRSAISTISITSTRFFFLAPGKISIMHMQYYVVVVEVVVKTPLKRAIEIRDEEWRPTVVQSHGEDDSEGVFQAIILQTHSPNTTTSILKNHHHSYYIPLITTTKLAKYAEQHNFWATREL